MVWNILKNSTQRKRKRGFGRWDLSDEVLRWSSGDVWRVADACMGTFVSGTSGSGKSTGSIRCINRAFLEGNWGGIYFTSKIDDTAIYTSEIAAAGRLDDLLVFSPDTMLAKYNFIDAEMRQNNGGPGMAEGIVELLMTASELMTGRRNGGNGDNAYFHEAAKGLGRDAVCAMMFANEPMTVRNIHRFITSGAASREQVASEAWQKESYQFQVLAAADRAEKTESQRLDFDLVLSRCLQQWPNLAPKTRSCVESTLTTTTDLLSRGAARDLLSSPTTNVTPQMCHDGALVIVGFPTLVYGDIARLIQVIIKYCWQRAHGRRDVSRNPRPTFMISDESHLLAVDADQVFQTTARSSRTAVVNATQSLSNYLEAFGEGGEARVHSYLGNLATSLFHAQTDTKTIAYAQELIGRRRQLFLNGSSSGADDWLGSMMGGTRQTSTGFSESYEFELQSGDFNGLAKGGPPRWETQAVLFQGGKRLRNGRTWVPVTFKQRH